METRELTVLAGSFVSFQLLFSVVSPRLSTVITPGYGRLPATKLTEWNSSREHARLAGLRVKETNSAYQKEIHNLPVTHKRAFIHSRGENLPSPFCPHVNGTGCFHRAKETEAKARQRCPTLVSTVHALVVGLFCLYILWFDDVVNADPVW
ncbi:Transmembrane protein 56-B [Liparis tanakae]|uniref:Transmembrane protein 56-B n=1 Tax=Liparis tanakae TaxID=230148 RepID=A0A4Z2EZB5_9TELE|nr:Transmembrane protein 56-B [Liparis tanakae]